MNIRLSEIIALTLFKLKGRPCAIEKFLLSVAFAFVFSGTLIAQNQKTVRVGYFNSAHLMEGHSDDDIKTGYAYEILHEISNHTGWDYDYIYGSWDEVFKQFMEGKIDIMPGVAKRSDRTPYMNWSKNPIDILCHSIFVRSNDSSFDPEKPETINGKKIGIMVNSNMTDEFLAWAKKRELTPECIQYGDINALVSDLDRGIVDGIICSEYAIDNSHQIRSFARFTETKSFIAVRKDDANLLSELDSAMEKINDEKPMFYEHLKAKYYSKRVTNASLSEDELEWIKNHGTINVGCIRDFLPYCKMTENGLTAGVITDVFSSIISTLQAGDRLKVNYKSYATYNAMIDALKNGEVDAIFPVLKSVWHSERSNMIETEPLVFSTISAIYDGTFNSSKMERLAVSRTFDLQKIFIMENYPDSKILWYPNIVECLKAVERNEASATIFNSSQAHVLLESGHSSLKDIGIGKMATYSIGVKKGNSAVMSLLNRGISLVDVNYFSQLIFNYVDYGKNASMKTFLKQNVLAVIFSIMLISLTVITIILLLYGKARKTELKLLKTNRRLQKKRHELVGSIRRIKEINEIIYAANIGIWKIILQDGKLPKFQASAKALELLGAVEGQMTDEQLYDHWLSRVKKSSLPSVNASVQEMIEKGFSENTYTWIHPQRGSIYVRCGGYSQKLDDGKIVLHGYHSDVTETLNSEAKQKQLLADALEEVKKQKQLLQQALDNYKEADYDRRRDFLTGLRNRQDLFELLQDVLSEKRSRITAMFLMDIDNFKKLNDRYGHSYGDECLKKIGHALNGYSENHDIYFYRYGGEEILGISFEMEEIHENTANEIVRLISSLEIKRDDSPFGVVTVSLGYTADNRRYEKMIDKADIAMYKAKELGKNRAVCFDELKENESK